MTESRGDRCKKTATQGQKRFIRECQHVCSFEDTLSSMAQWLSWLERRPVTAEVVSSSLIWVVTSFDVMMIFKIWGLSSAGRASALQAEGHRFEPYRPHRNHGWIPEWPKGADCKSVGTAFEGSNPSPPIQMKKIPDFSSVMSL